MERKKQRISDLFYDNRFLLVFSVIFALIAWLIVATEFSETQNTILNVPVQINNSNVNSLGGLQAFVDKQYTVDVTISGKRYIVESDDIKDDILVIADTSLVNSPGDFSLNLSVTSKSVRPEYEFVSVSPQVTDKITFDYLLEGIEFKVVPEINFKNDAVAKDFYLGDISVLEVSSVKISGPETAVSKVVGVVARAEHEGGLDKSTTINATLTAIDENGSAVQGVRMNRNSSKVNIKIPVYSKHVLPVSCSFSNIPTEYIGNIPFEYTISPAKATFGIFDDGFDKESIEISSKIDFNELTVGENKIEIDIGPNEFPGAILLDEDVTQFIVTVYVPDYMSKNIVMNPENIIVENLPSDINVEFSEFQSTTINVIGPKDYLASLTEENLILVADFDFGEYNESGSIVVPIRVEDGYCWSYKGFNAVYDIV